MNQPDQVVSFAEILFGNFLVTMKDMFHFALALNIMWVVWEGIYGYPIEIQALFFMALWSAKICWIRGGRERVSSEYW